MVRKFEDYWEEWKGYFYMNVAKDEAEKIWDAAWEAAIKSVGDKTTVGNKEVTK